MKKRARRGATSGSATARFVKHKCFEAVFQSQKFSSVHLFCLKYDLLPGRATRPGERTKLQGAFILFAYFTYFAV